jgi:hypothetical protein
MRHVTYGLAAAHGNGERGVALAISEVRGIVERACARQDVLDACARRDLGTVITVLGAHGLTQGQIAELTGLSQGHLGIVLVIPELFGNAFGHWGKTVAAVTLARRDA